MIRNSLDFIFSLQEDLEKEKNENSKNHQKYFCPHLDLTSDWLSWTIYGKFQLLLDPVRHFLFKRIYSRFTFFGQVATIDFDWFLASTGLFGQLYWTNHV